MSAQMHQFPDKADRLEAIASEINRELQAASRNALESAILIGECLIEAKKLAGHGNFAPWLERNFGKTRHQAGKYMRAARHAEELRSKGNSELPFDLNLIPTLLRLPDDPEEIAEIVEEATQGLADTGVENPTAAQVRRAIRKHKQTKPPKKRQKALEACDLLTDKGEPLSAKVVKEIAGVGKSVAAEAIAIREAGTEPAELAPLSMTAQQKLDAWQRKLEAEFDYRVRTASQKWLDEIRIPIYEKKIEEIERMLKWPRNAVMTKEEYKKVVMCLHPDGINSRTKEQLEEAFRIFTHYKPKMVSDEEETRRVLSDLPRTREELLARKKQK